MNTQQASESPCNSTPIPRRSLIGQFGVGAATVMAAGAMSLGTAATISSSAEAQTITDADIFNFALNLEYIEGEYYNRGFFGTGLLDSDVSGAGGAGFVLGGSAVPFQTAAIAGFVEKIVVDEVDHIRFLRGVLGSQAVARPNIDLLNSFNALAAAAGLIPAGTQFNPFLNEINFMLGAFILTDVGVTAYAGAAKLLQSKDNVDAAAGLLATEAYHAGAIRATLTTLGQQPFGNAVSALRTKVGGGPDSGLSVSNINYNIANTDSSGLTYRRTSAQVLSIVYNGIPTGGGFLPNQANGTIR